MIVVVMLLARAPGRPDGDISDRLEMRLCLTADARIDERAYAADPLPWPTRRVDPDGRVFTGEIIRTDAGWAIRRTGSEDDPLWPFEPVLLRPGEYVAVRPPEGDELIYRIVGVDKA